MYVRNYLSFIGINPICSIEFCHLKCTVPFLWFFFNIWDGNCPLLCEFLLTNVLIYLFEWQREGDCSPICWFSHQKVGLDQENPAPYLSLSLTHEGSGIQACKLSLLLSRACPHRNFEMEPGLKLRHNNMGCQHPSPTWLNLCAKYLFFA